MAKQRTPQETIKRYVKRKARIGQIYERLSLPLTVWMLFTTPTFAKQYAMTWPKKFRLARRIYRNCLHIQTGTSYKGHLAMAYKLLELPPGTEGVVVECGAWLGGATANLSIICELVGRDLIVYDSFEGVPEPEPGDDFPTGTPGGAFRGELDVVQENVRKYGAIDRCTFRKGWFKDTLPDHAEPIALAFLDVDLKSSLHDCVVNLWPHLIDVGYVFIDDFVHLHNCALFFSERFWADYLDTRPPGLIGTGTGVGVGQYFLGPWRGPSKSPPIQRPTSLAYTRKDFDGLWDYRPLDTP
jgi:O-methyltransferase